MKTRIITLHLWVAALSALLAFSGCQSRSAASTETITLSRQNTTPYLIVIGKDAKPYEKTAAQELSSYLEKISQVAFPVVVETDTPPAGPVISVGMTKRLAHAFPDLDLAKLKPDSIVLKTHGRNLYLVGEGSRGTLYAVHSFLEDQCGVRWWTPFEETVSLKPELSVGLLDIVYQPPFSYRDTNSHVFNGTIMQTQHLKNTKGQEERLRFSARCKNNALAIGTIPETWGGSLSMIMSFEMSAFHESNYFISIGEFGKTHPEWFCEINGQRQFGALHLTQLCLSNEEMRAEYLRRAITWVDGLPKCRSFVIMHNDNEYYCQCARCAAVDAEEGSPMGSQMRFLNFLAEKLEERRPGIQLWMDAYHYTTKPPKITRPRANLGIILCTPIMSQRLSQDSDFMRKWEAWKPIAPKVLIWDYTVNFGKLVNPWPNLRHLGPNIKTIASNGASGVFEQGNIFNSVSDCDELKSWVISHMLWEPSRDSDALIAEFVNGYYGAAAKPVMAYLDHIVACGDAVKGGIKGGDEWLDLAAMNTATQYLDEARDQAANNSTLEERVARVRLTLDYQWLTNWRQYREQANRSGQPFLGPESALKALAAFRKDNARFNSTHDCEQWGYGTMAEQLNTMEAALTSSLGSESLPPPYDKVPAADRLHLQENRLSPAGRDAKIVDDPLASNGKAMRTSCNHKDWNIQVHEKFLRTVCRMTALSGKWRVISYVRADAKAAHGNAMQVGIHSYKVPAMCVTKTLKIEQLDPNGYTPIEVGTIDFDQDSKKVSVWAGPMDNPDVMNAIYVDRVVLIREP